MPTSLEPPESWQQKTAFGFMGFDRTKAGRLVRLADVLRWLGEHPSPLPYAAALEALCSNMPPDVMQWLYQVKPGGGYATPLPADSMFGYMTAAQIEAANAKARQDALQRDLMAQKNGRFGGGWGFEAGKVTTTPRQPVEPGLPALLKCIKTTWVRELYKGEPTTDHPKTALSYFAIPLEKAVECWGYGQKLEAASLDTPVRPVDGWEVQSSYGTLRTHGGVDLVRLEDVHAWMCRNGQPAKDATYKIFAPFYEACLSAADNGDDCALSLPGNLFVANASTWPNGLLAGNERSKVEAVKFFASAFPDLGHVRFVDGSVGGLVYAMAEGALRVWHGAADLSTDHLATRKDAQERASDSKHGILWPKDDDLRKLMGRVAVPFATAYVLWNWGSVAEVVQLHSVATGDATPSTWTALVSHRKNNAGHAWTQGMRSLLVEEENRRKAAGHTGIRKSMASELSAMTTSGLGDHIRKASTGTKSGRGRKAA